MSQEVFDTIDPTISGTELATILNDFKAALMSGLSGTTRPDELDPGGAWVDMTNDPTSWSFKIWTGTTDVEVFTLDLVSALASVALAVEEFSVKKVTADVNGAILNLIKQRIANSGQVLSGDVVGEIRFIGRGDDASNPVVAKIIWEASDDMTTSAYGGELSFHSVPDASGTLTKHLRFINGIAEFLVPLKVNSLRPASVNVATAATIAQLAADTSVVEMTGSTATDIQGVKSDDDSKVVTIHNRSSAAVTLKHQNGTASANDRLKLPNSADYIIAADASVTLYYCTADSRWKLMSTSDKNFSGLNLDTYYGPYNVQAIPAGVTTVRVRAYRKLSGLADGYNGLMDNFGSLYAWGYNGNGLLGLGDVTPRSSPVAVLGGLTFLRAFGVNGTSVSMYGIASNGSAYAWGGNPSGMLGVGDNTVRSSPVAVLGGLKFNTLHPRDAFCVGITTGNVAYAWGHNANGHLGVGDTTSRSSPIAVLGGLKFAKVLPISGGTGEASVMGMNLSGTLYAWGNNVNGQLGLGDVTVRSSPVAVLGGLTFSDFYGGANSSRYFFAALSTAGVAYAWGNNARGQLGVGDTTPRSSPVAVAGGLTFKQIITHPKSESVYGLTSAGVLYAWGENSQGELGVGDTVARSSPVAVLGGLTFAKFKLFKNIAMGLTQDGTLYAWGSNGNGQLGVGDVVSRSSPVAVLGGLKFMDVFWPEGFNDANSVYGVQVDGTLYAWGANTNGTLGLGDVTPRSSPVAVLGGLRADTTELAFSADLTVVPSSNYTVGINSGLAYFGTNPLGQNCYKVEVEYLK